MSEHVHQRGKARRQAGGPKDAGDAVGHLVEGVADLNAVVVLPRKGHRQLGLGVEVVKRQRGSGLLARPQKVVGQLEQGPKSERLRPKPPAQNRMRGLFEVSLLGPVGMRVHGLDSVLGRNRGGTDLDRKLGALREVVGVDAKKTRGSQGLNARIHGLQVPAEGAFAVVNAKKCLDFRGFRLDVQVRAQAQAQQGRVVQAPLQGLLPKPQYFVFFAPLDVAKQRHGRFAQPRRERNHRASFVHPKGVPLEQQFNENEVFEAYRTRVEQTVGQVLDGRHHPRPALVGKLLVKEVVRKERGIADHLGQHVFELKVGVKQGLAHLRSADQVDRRRRFELRHGRAKGLGARFGKAPNGNSLVEVAVDEAKELGVHQGVEVDSALALPGAPQLAHAFPVLVLEGGEVHLLLPLGAFGLGHRLQGIGNCGLMDFSAAVPGTVVAQRQRGFVAQQFVGLFQAKEKRVLLERVQAVVVHKVLERSLCGQVVLQFVKHVVAIKGAHR